MLYEEDVAIDIKPRKPHVPFDFTQAITQPFQSEDGKGFAWRLIFWMAGLTSIFMLISLPMLLKHYPALLEHNWENMQAVFSDGTPPDPAAILPIYASMAPGFAILMIGWIGVYVAGETALHRKLIHGIEASKIPLRFGRDESRVLLAQLSVFGLWMVLYTFGLIIVGVLGGGAMTISPILGIAIIGIGLVVVLGVMIWVPIRLAPAAALSSYRSRLHVLAARHVTKYKFWNLFLAYLVVGVIGYVALYVLSVLLMVVVAGDPNLPTALSGFGADNPRIVFETASERFSNPLVIVLGVFAVIVYSLAYTLWGLCLSGIATHALKWWRDDDPSEKFD